MHFLRALYVISFCSGLFLCASFSLGTAQPINDLKSLQRSLALAGYSPGPIDGLYGQQTEEAYSMFLRDFAEFELPNDPRHADEVVYSLLTTAFNDAQEIRELERSHLQRQMDVEDAIHLLYRTGFGAHPREIEHLVGLSRSQAISIIIEGLDVSDPTQDPLFWTEPDQYPPYWITSDLSADQKISFENQRDVEISSLREWWANEMIATSRPAGERLVLFWHNHFPTSYSSLEHRSYAVWLQHRLFRDLGSRNFKDMTHAILRDAAMLEFLDNQGSSRDNPNENFARELLELFLLGEGNYTESDVKEASRALTGYTYNPLRRMEFFWQPWRHDPGFKNILGEADIRTADDLVETIFNQDRVSVHLAEEAWHTFISPYAIDELEIEKIAREFRNSDYEIKALYRSLLASEAFWAEHNRNVIIKSPIDLIIGGIRSFGLIPSSSISITSTLAGLGQNLFEPPNVAGWPGGEAWVTPSRMLDRRSVLSLLSGQLNQFIELSQDERDALLSDDSNAGVSTEMEDEGNIVEIRYAAENFDGPPTFALSVLEDHPTLPVWRSPLITAEGGIDTARFGRTMPQNLDWRIARIEIPQTIRPTGFRLSFTNDLVSPVGASAGDRNLYVDWVAFGEAVYFARDAEVRSDCPPGNDDITGHMYCNGSLTFSESQIVGLDSDTNQAGTLLRRDHSISRAVFRYGEAVSVSEDSTLVISLYKSDINGIKHEAIEFRVEQSEGRLYIVFSEAGCLPSCFSSMPVSRNELLPSYASYRFPLDLTDQVRNTGLWASLSEDERQWFFILRSALPQIFASARLGENWVKNNGHEIFRSWEGTLGVFFQDLEQASEFPSVVIQNEQEEFGAMMAMGSLYYPPDRVAGLPTQQAPFTNYLDLSNGTSNGHYLQVNNPNSSVGHNQLEDLLLSPNFQLK